MPSLIYVEIVFFFCRKELVFFQLHLHPINEFSIDVSALFCFSSFIFRRYVLKMFPVDRVQGIFNIQERNTNVPDYIVVYYTDTLEYVYFSYII